MTSNAFVIGVDYGTDSVRTIIVNAATGAEVASAVFNYRRWRDGLYCDPSSNQFRQHPKDYVEGLEFTIKECLKTAGDVVRKSIKAIAIDTTGSTPIAVDREGTPLALKPGFEENPNAMFVLWKDHTSTKEALEINAHAEKFETNYLQFVGGIYSSEWFWAKLLHVLREDAKVREACYSWVEHCDWIPYLLTGGTDVHQMKRGVCSAGHKALWAAEFGGLPPDNFFSSLDPLLKGFTSRLFKQVYTSDTSAGNLSQAWADRLGLPTTVVVGVGAFDCHMGAVGGQIEPYHLSKVMGTSTCDMMVIPKPEMHGKLVRGICGQVDGSIIPGMIGLEAGQSAFGDTYAWYKNLLAWPIETLLTKSSVIDQATAEKLKLELLDKILPELTNQASALPLLEDDELAMDWLNGRRTPDANQLLKGALAELNLGSNAATIFKAWIEATCFGAKAIVDRFVHEGVPVKGLIGLGGVAKKSPYIMQVMADVMNMPIRIHRSEQTCALGAAMFAATAAKIYPRVEEAMNVMGQGFDTEYKPRPLQASVYSTRYAKYRALGEAVEKRSAVVVTQKPSVDKYHHIRQSAYEANMQLPKLGLVVFTFGNVSAVDRSLGVFAIKPSGVPYDELSPEKMVIVDFDGNVVDGMLRPSSDTKTHAVLYKHWPNIGGIVHTHSTYGTAWAQSLRDIPIYGTTHADHNTVDIPCAPPMHDTMIQGDYEYQTGFQIMNCLSERKMNYEEVEMVLVGNHAPFAWGKTPGKAVYNSAVLEEIAKMAYITEQINPDPARLKDTLIKKHFERKHGPDSYYGQS